MESKMKVVTLLVGVLLVSAGASAATWYTPWAATGTLNWDNSPIWLNGDGTWAAATTPPLSTDVVNLAFTGGSALTPNGSTGESGANVTIFAGSTATAKQLIMGGKTYYDAYGAPYNQTEGDLLNVYGALNISDTTGGLYFGHTSAATLTQLKATDLNIYAGANVNVYALRVMNKNLSAAPYRINQTGGTVYFDQLSLGNTGDLSTVLFNISGGTLTIPDSNYGVAPASNRQLIFDISQTGALVLENGRYGALMGLGFIKANGVIVTAENKASLITETAVNVVNAAGATVACTQVTLIPEPATLALLGLGAIAAFRRKR
jgi:hypothetical protein